MTKGTTTTLPANDGYPGLQVTWAKDCRPAFHNGTHAAERWLNGKRSHWLWAALILERDALPDETDRKAFEVAFISRIQQSFGGNWLN